MNFRVFALIVVGMCIVGISLGYVLGFYLRNVCDSNYWAYLAAPLLGFGSGLIMFGVLFNKNTET